MSLICTKLNHVIAEHANFSGNITQGIIYLTPKLIQSLLHF